MTQRKLAVCSLEVRSFGMMTVRVFDCASSLLRLLTVELLMWWYELLHQIKLESLNSLLDFHDKIWSATINLANG